ncbi:undecaprenyl/decaprenyl-phosphate alpha-N-acetylglucosaminyl 1-phosphate transferase [Candidatus Pelagibacter sp.]|nr:undecaprenyl/decaprenyl-phosphate alpha-N-acetylglucosaminyl 1-phosphate transferase [Candidatus Pelagibacter sp.]
MHVFNLYLLIFVSINFLLILYFDKISIFHHVIDKPDNVRKFHPKPVPLAGGIILILNLILYFFILTLDNNIFLNQLFFDQKYKLYLFITLCLLIFLIGLIDDKINLSPLKKFLFLSIIVFVALNFDQNLIISDIRISSLELNIKLGKFSFLFSYFCFIVFLNAFNMFDGINLQSSIYSIIIFSFILIFHNNNFFIQILLIYLFFFSYLNYKNKSFLGDGGTLLIAFIISYVFIKLYNLELIRYTDQIFIYMMLPGIDLIRLFFKRIVNKKNPLRPDRNHLHHLLIKKFTNIKSLLIMQFLIIIPLLISYYNVDIFIIILSSIIIYSMTIYLLEK